MNINYDDLVKTFVERAMMACDRKGVSFCRLYEDFGVPVHYVGEEIEYGLPCVDKIVEIANYFGVSTDYLLGR